MRAVLAKIWKVWDPHLVLDLHTTNGTRHGYSLTYSPPLGADVDAEIQHWSKEVLLPAVREKLREKHDILTFDYGNSSSRGGERSWSSFSSLPRYVTNHAGERNRFGILSEATSFLPFAHRIKATSLFTATVIDFVADHVEEVLRICQSADRRSELLHATGATLGLEFETRSRGIQALLLEKRIEGRNTPAHKGPQEVESIPHDVRADFDATVTTPIPAGWLIPAEEKDLIERLDFSSVQILVVGSAPVHEELMNRLAETFGVTVIQSYGLTEGGPVMLGPPPDGRPVPYDSAGAAWPEGEVKLVGADGKDHDSYGELWVRNPGVISGYYNLPEVNKQRIVDGWLRTGDLFACDDEGFYYFKGRTDDMFNCGGENVYPKEVENLLLSHPEAVEACVVAVPHATKGHAPVAMVALSEGAKADEAALRAFCLEHGPAYSHPRRVVVIDKVPLTGAGKIDRAGITKTLSERFGTLTSDR